GTSSFQILALTMVVNFPAVILTDAIFAYNKQKYLIAFVLIGGILNVVLDLLLIPKFGIVGSAWATLIAQSVANVYLWYKMRQINYFNIIPYLKRIVPVSILMAILAWILISVGVPVLVVIGLAVIFYFGVLYVTKEPLIGEVKEALRHIG
ncbi:MAG: polysaccharide biosynthesis C-terminal domain-containing protein, partial [bacterium]|nr:polysaccharide biosynthesis C-terminal domain-containing protein [bacterium]